MRKGNLKIKLNLNRKSSKFAILNQNLKEVFSECLEMLNFDFDRVKVEKGFFSSSKN